ncbi:2-amino-4-hydroxy-6-hydroxymethyldihydropteridine diphosphokinase [Saliterribacillus persicus]|uniref:2-amino-4-hydroxy-6-hydroxymethyldihydropteridine diphosphokinase n=1 Tax=Saliterribacillus persicus TaxID=930114 RepID=A0A368X509_9BACI|nr:2-amino-4-hydroxy-6-hydroxymethyldihydropteridine diphosphokinase [Saliterribacillus persicus]RCW63023.1 2-amino-4-hydroxy-6-hydroxymethyldihydropteridine diphosphokinase [Saliterribacillus persicus]
MRAYLALGSNIESRQEYLVRAIHALEAVEYVTIKQLSSVFETEPVGKVDQGKFLNMVIEVATTLTPEQLLKLCQQVEKSLGRKREVKWGPRTIDLDILFYEKEKIDTATLTLPHPGISDRAFVLIPLVEIIEDHDITLEDQTLSQLLERLPEEDKEGVIKWGTIYGGNV